MARKPGRPPAARRKLLTSAFAVASLTVLGTIAGAHPAAASTATPSTAADRADLAQYWAPVDFQDTDTSGKTSLGGKSDYLTSYDFDGDLNGRNNWEDASQYDLPAHVYYSVEQTGSFTYLDYMFFHARDWADGSLDDYMEDDSEHENDSEGALVVIKNDGSDHGKLEAVVTVAHTNFYSWLPKDSDFSSGDQDIDGAIATTSSPHDDGHQRPWIGEQSKTHAAWAMGATRVPSPALQDQYDNGDGVMYYPSSDGTAEVPDGPNDRDVQYSLIDVFTPGGMWDQRNNTSLFATPDHFAGDDGGDPFGAKCGDGTGLHLCDTDAASPPWGWDDADDLPGVGQIATDPATLVWDYFSWPDKPDSADTNYTWNAYAGVTPADPPQNAPFGDDPGSGRVQDPDRQPSSPDGSHPGTAPAQPGDEQPPNLPDGTDPGIPPVQAPDQPPNLP